MDDHYIIHLLISVSAQIDSFLVAPLYKPSIADNYLILPSAHICSCLISGSKPGVMETRLLDQGMRRVLI